MKKWIITIAVLLVLACAFLAPRPSWGTKHKADMDDGAWGSTPYLVQT